MDRSDEFKEGWRSGSRWVIGRIHKYAELVSDEYAKAALNTCAAMLGDQAKDKLSPTPAPMET